MGRYCKKRESRARQCEYKAKQRNAILQEKEHIKQYKEKINQDDDYKLLDKKKTL